MRQAIEYEPVPERGTPEGQAGAYAVIQYRDWCDEYRIRTRIETTTGTVPPENVGPRISLDLSNRGLRKIAESCQYVALQHGGYKTFLTLTFDSGQRERLVAGETSIQREVTRFADALQKVWARGWDAEDEKTGAIERQPGQNKPLLYLWVVEVPENSEGEPNPHVHMLLNWRVEKRHFRSWAVRFEKLWGQGFAHLEKIKDSEAAGAYMMKAAGYLCKAQGKSDQGEVRGNRYGMSAAARAPDWVTIEEKQLHIMGALIADVHQHVQEKYGEAYQARRKHKKRLETLPKDARKTRRIVGRQLEKVRSFLTENVPVVASKYQILLKGKDAYRDFMAWARFRGEWRAGVVPWLPDKGPGENYRPGERPDSQWMANFKKVHYWRRACRAAARLAWNEWEWQQARGQYDEYPELAAA